MTATFERIKIDRITPHDRNVRRNLGDLDELAASIKAQGLLQPLVVAPVAITQEEQKASSGLLPQRYVLIAGHRRLAAAQQAKVESVPCIVRDDLDSLAKQVEAMLCENLMRSDLTVMEEADAYAQLELLGVKEAAISKTTGRSRKTVHERLLLASLPTERREQYEEGNLSLDGAVACAKLRAQYADDAEILELIDKAGTWSFRGTYGVKAQIDRILDARKRAAEPDPEPAVDTYDDEDYEDDEVEGQSTIDGQIRVSAWEERQKAQNAALDRMYDWLSERIVAEDRHVMSGILDLAIDVQVTDYDVRGLPELFGIEPPGEDEDVADANARIAADVKALNLDDRTLFVAICVADLVGSYFHPDRLRNFQSLGYPLTADDKALLPVEEDDDAVA